MIHKRYFDNLRATIVCSYYVIIVHKILLLYMYYLFLKEQ